MSNFYIYKFDYPEIEKGNERYYSSTIIFCDRKYINEDNLKYEIRSFYEENYQTDKIFVLGGEYLQEELTEVFITKQNETFIAVPKRQETHLKDNLFVLTFDKCGTIKGINKPIPKAFLKKFINEGVQNIFIKRGGLITSEGSHHYVFPSGKHSDRFLRAGNVLLMSSEIYFIAFALLKHFDECKYTQIYCDTSSINSVAFALIELKNRFLDPKDARQIPIESFSSYEGLYKNPISYSANALLLISASTSSNIISYILDKHKMIERSNIIILYFLGEDVMYSGVKDKVICNLTQSNTNPTGIPFYKTFKEDNCEYCKKGSYPVAVSGDVFLLEKPKINKILVTVKDAEKNLSDFVKQFKSDRKTETVLKVNYKEKSSNKYEIYIDYYELLDGLAKHDRFKIYREKLNNYINQYVPGNLKYIVSLNDIASVNLSEYILNKIKDNYQLEKVPLMINFDNINDIENIEGAILVVGSCISNGKNLLYISRALRKFNQLRIIYFIGISRTKNKDYLNVLKSNLKYGNYGPDSNSFITVDTIYCDNNSKNTSWSVETSFINTFIDFLKDQDAKSEEVQSFLVNRKNILLNSSSNKVRGLAEDLFYPKVTTTPYEKLNIRKNFAFFNFDKYDEDVTQSDIYFTINNILNTLRNSEKDDKNLRQTAFVRNLISPDNFSRFNDGIIQASILRAASSDELSYNIDNDSSQDMANTLETIIKYYKEDQGEALIEFLYAIAIKKLTLKTFHLLSILELIKEKCHEDIFQCFHSYILYELMGINPTVDVSQGKAINSNINEA